MAQVQDTQQQVSTTGDSTKFASGLNIVAGIWLIIAPFLLGYSEFATAMWNDIIIGAVVMILAAIRVANPERTSGLSWVNVVLGVWLIAAPFVLTYTEIGAALWNDIIVGVVIAGLAIWSAMTTPADEPQ